MARAAKASTSDICYLVQIGAARYVSSYLEKGRVILKNETISCGPAMQARLLNTKYQDIRTNEMMPYFRVATEKEAEAYINRLDNLDPISGDPRLIAEAARNEARKMGIVERGEAKELERQEAEEEKLQPKTRRRRKSGAEED